MLISDFEYLKYIFNPKYFFSAFTSSSGAQIAESPQLIDGQQMLIDGSHIVPVGNRPARTKKLTEKGLDYHRTISHKNDVPNPPGTGPFRVPGFSELNGGELSPGGPISIKTGNTPGITTGSRIETVQTLPANPTVANFNDFVWIRYILTCFYPQLTERILEIVAKNSFTLFEGNFDPVFMLHGTLFQILGSEIRSLN